MTSVNEQIHPAAGRYEQALCNLPDCGQPLHITWTAGMAIYLSTTLAELADESGAHTRTWQVECEAGHVVLLPPDNAADYNAFGQCGCVALGDYAQDERMCGHHDLARLRRVLRAADDDGICRKEGCPNLGGVWRDCPENADA